jgi:hypothetical protein
MVDVDLSAATVTVAHNRVSVNGQAMDSQPKTDNTVRTLPLTPALSRVSHASIEGVLAIWRGCPLPEDRQVVRSRYPLL